MITSDSKYLELQLRSKKLELAEVQVQHRIAIATYATKVDMLQAQIDSIEKQLNNPKV